MVDALQPARRGAILNDNRGKKTCLGHQERKDYGVRKSHCVRCMMIVIEGWMDGWEREERNNKKRKLVCFVCAFSIL